LSKVKLGEKHVQGYQVKHSNRSNSAADCSIAFKFGTRTEFHHVTDDMLQMFKVKDQGHRVKGQGHGIKECISSKKTFITTAGIYRVTAVLITSS